MALMKDEKVNRVKSMEHKTSKRQEKLRILIAGFSGENTSDFVLHVERRNIRPAFASGRCSLPWNYGAKLPSISDSMVQNVRARKASNRCMFNATWLNIEMFESRATETRVQPRLPSDPKRVE